MIITKIVKNAFNELLKTKIGKGGKIIFNNKEVWELLNITSTLKTIKQGAKLGDKYYKQLLNDFYSLKKKLREAVRNPLSAYCSTESFRLLNRYSREHYASVLSDKYGINETNFIHFADDTDPNWTMRAKIGLDLEDVSSECFYQYLKFIKVF